VKVTVSVKFPAINVVTINVQSIYPDGSKRLSIVTFKSKGTTDGDFSLLDFNDDFY
jgi:hypothetical protein